MSYTHIHGRTNGQLVRLSYYLTHRLLASVTEAWPAVRRGLVHALHPSRSVQSPSIEDVVGL